MCGIGLNTLHLLKGFEVFIVSCKDARNKVPNQEILSNKFIRILFLLL